MDMKKAEEATARLIEIMDTLREQCPWDREQTFESLRHNTIEETYELADAIVDGNMEGIKEELGDLMLHVVFYSKLGDEQHAFDYTDVVNGVCDKLIYRHPHVYGDIHADTPQQVKENWEALKLRKKNRKSGTLGGVPRSRHLTGQAVDVAVGSHEQERFCALARRLGFRSVLPDPRRNYVHLSLEAPWEISAKRER